MSVSDFQPDDLWAQNGIRTKPPEISAGTETSIDHGFGCGPVDAEQFNWLFRVSTYFASMQQQYGTVQYVDAYKTYYQEGAMVWQNNVMYQRTDRITGTVLPPNADDVANPFWMNVSELLVAQLVTGVSPYSVNRLQDYLNGALVNTNNTTYIRSSRNTGTVLPPTADDPVSPFWVNLTNFVEQFIGQSQAGGVTVWDSGNSQNYGPSAIVKGSDGRLYFRTQRVGGTITDPTNDDATNPYWVDLTKVGNDSQKYGIAAYDASKKEAYVTEAMVFYAGVIYFRTAVAGPVLAPPSAHWQTFDDRVAVGLETSVLTIMAPYINLGNVQNVFAGVIRYTAGGGGTYDWDVNNPEPAGWTLTNEAGAIGRVTHNLGHTNYVPYVTMIRANDGQTEIVDGTITANYFDFRNRSSSGAGTDGDALMLVVEDNLIPIP